MGSHLFNLTNAPNAVRIHPVLGGCQEPAGGREIVFSKQA